ncbi:MAG: hypothetical protein GF372_13320 [Candidatus Marinimicrobia bacterium]|nr:hypothetical protein [Candidatus Neomarinimicrobiota bacterium]
MPNTLAHIGVQSILTRSVLKSADFIWIYIGLIIPDIPWIIQRAIRTVYPAVDLLMLRSYSIIQATLIGSLLLSFLIAYVTREQWKVFAILGLNACLHLIIDAGQLKYANGVHFLAPFSWEMTNWGLFSIEGVVTYVLTGFGLFYLFWSWRSLNPLLPKLKKIHLRQILVLSMLMILYFTFPLLLLEKPVQANNHYLKTLQNSENRTGEYIELDRASFKITNGNKVIKPGHYSEWFQVKGLPVENSASVSIKGFFSEQKVITVNEYKVHTDWFRDMASYAGLVLVVLTLIVTIFLGRSLKKPLSVLPDNIT